jgi:hypothetical protein
MSLEKCTHNFDSSTGESCPECLKVQVVQENIEQNEENNSPNPGSSQPKVDDSSETEKSKGTLNDGILNNNADITEQINIKGDGNVINNYFKEVRSSNSIEDEKLRPTSLYKNSSPIISVRL